MARLKKVKKPVKVVDRPYRMSSGTPNQQGPASAYATEKQAKTAAGKVFTGYTEWCKRYNSAGLEAIQSALEELAGLPVLITEPRKVTHTIDNHTMMTIEVRLWKE